MHIASVCNHGEVRLFGGYNEYQYGVAEVCINGLWADICQDVSQTPVARTFCKQLIGGQSRKQVLITMCMSLLILSSYIYSVFWFFMLLWTYEEKYWQSDTLCCHL